MPGQNHGPPIDLRDWASRTPYRRSDRAGAVARRDVPPSGVGLPMQNLTPEGLRIVTDAAPTMSAQISLPVDTD